MRNPHLPISYALNCAEIWSARALQRTFGLYHDEPHFHWGRSIPRALGKTSDQRTQLCTKYPSQTSIDIASKWVVVEKSRGWYAQPANWRANTLIAGAFMFGIVAVTWKFSAERETWAHKPEPWEWHPSRYWSKQLIQWDKEDRLKAEASKNAKE